MRRLVVDIGALAEALDQPAGAGTRTFFDCQTGAFEYVPRIDDEEDNDAPALFADVLSRPERYVEVRPLSASERARLRMRFADDVEDPQARLRLTQALDEDDDAGARFAAALRRTPGLLADWLRFRDDALAPKAERWLAAHDIECPRGQG